MPQIHSLHMARCTYSCCTWPCRPLPQPAPVGEDEEEKPGDTYEGEFAHGKRHGKVRLLHVAPWQVKTQGPGYHPSSDLALHQ